MEKVAVLYICTGKYLVFWSEFYQSANRYLLPECEVSYFVYTDAPPAEVEGANSGRVHIIPQKPMGWPFDTLKRFELFLRCEEQLKNYDYLFFFNANAKFMQPVTAEMLLPRAAHGEALLFVQHPGYFDKPCEDFTYDRNPKSLAYIPVGQGEVYICGGVNGGTSAAFLQLCHTLHRNIEDDLARGVIAAWHDESHINHYLLGRSDYRLLPPSFCYPENFQLPFDCIVQIRDKARYIDVGVLRKGAPETPLPPQVRLYNKLRRAAVRLVRRCKGGQ